VVIEKMAMFPFFVEMEGRACLVVGGGAVACRKAEQMLSFGADVNVVAERFVPAFDALKEQYQERLTLCQRSFVREDIKRPFCVIAATDEAVLNETIADICKEREILVNVVDQKQLCSFYMSCVVREDELVVGISSGGNSPVTAQRLKAQIAPLVTPELGAYNAQLGEVREMVLKRVAEQRRKACFQALLDLCERHGRTLTAQEMDAVVKRYE
jgi:siroheme synthase-like protein